MKRKISFSLIIFIIFIVFSKNYVFAEGTCKCIPRPIVPSNPKSLTSCLVDESFQNTCPDSGFRCLTGPGGFGCQSGNSCECVSVGTGGTIPPIIIEKDTTPVTIPGYPTQDANQKPLAGLLTNQNLTLGTIIGKALTYVYVVAGLALLLVLIMGGISLMTAAGDPKKIEAGYGKIKDGLIGFLIVFVSYIVTQLVEVVLGVKIL